MKSYKMCIMALILLLHQINIKAQSSSDSLNLNDIINMSLQEMLNVKVSVSSTIPTDIFSSPSAVTVVNRELIDQYNFNSVAEAVRQVAGVEILQTVIDKNVPTMRGILQNFYANKVLIMINNVSVWHPTYGNSTLDRISINDVQRIEILKGPASVLYGTNAYNGVINIILREHNSTELNAQASAGYPNITGASVNYKQKGNDFSWSISANSHHEIREPYLMNGGKDTLKVDDSFLYHDDTLFLYTEQYRYSNINVDLRYRSHTLFINSFVNSYSHPGVLATYQTGANKSITDKGALFSYTFNKELSSKTQLKINAHYDYHSRDQLMSQAYAHSAQLASSRATINAKINHTFSEFLKAEIGGEFFDADNIQHKIVDKMQETDINENIDYNEHIVEGSGFGQLNFNYKWLSILGGFRYTHNINFGGNLSPRISTLFKINPNNSIKLVYGQSFRTPNLLELYFNHTSVIGNPDLKPETCSSFEFMYLTHINNFYGQITSYYSKYDNLIQRTRDGVVEGGPAEHRNLGSFEGVGTELELKYQNPKLLNVFFNYNYMYGLGANSESNFMYVPQSTLSLGLNKPIRQFFISSNLYTNSNVEGHLKPIDSQYLLDGHIGYKHKSQKGFQLIHTISLKNLLDSDMLIPEYIRQQPGVNSLPTTGFGRRIMYTLKLKF